MALSCSSTWVQRDGDDKVLIGVRGAQLDLGGCVLRVLILGRPVALSGQRIIGTVLFFFSNVRQGQSHAPGRVSA